jgi:hypothetical protein
VVVERVDGILNKLHAKTFSAEELLYFYVISASFQVYVIYNSLLLSFYTAFSE